MDEGDEPRSPDQIETGLRRDSDLEGQAGFATYVAAFAFGTGTLPTWMPEWQKLAIEREAALLQQLPGAVAFDDTALPSRRETEERRRDKDADFAANIYQKMIQQDQERAEWARTSSTVGGVTMTGAEWSDLAERLRSDEDLKSRIMAAFLSRGMTEKEAEARYERAAEVAEIVAIPPAQRTAEQKEVIKKADADPTFKIDIQATNALANDQYTPHPKSDLQNSFGSAVSGALPTERPTQTAEANPDRQVVKVDGLGF